MMKKNKILLPMMTTTIVSTMMPLVSCSCTFNPAPEPEPEPQPGTDAIEVNLTQHQTFDVGEGTIYYVYDNVDIVANQKYRFNIDLSLAEYPEESEFSIGNIYLNDGEGQIIKSYGLFEIFIDDVKFYDFISKGVDSSPIEQIYGSAESDLPELPDTFDWNSSIITFDIDFPSSYNDAEIGWMTYELG